MTTVDAVVSRLSTGGPVSFYRDENHYCWRICCLHGPQKNAHYRCCQREFGKTAITSGLMEMNRRLRRRGGLFTEEQLVKVFREVVTKDDKRKDIEEETLEKYAEDKISELQETKELQVTKEPQETKELQETKSGKESIPVETDDFPVHLLDELKSVYNLCETKKISHGSRLANERSAKRVARAICAVADKKNNVDIADELGDKSKVYKLIDYLKRIPRLSERFRALKYLRAIYRRLDLAVPFVLNKNVMYARGEVIKCTKAAKKVHQEGYNKATAKQREFLVNALLRLSLDVERYSAQARGLGRDDQRAHVLALLAVVFSSSLRVNSIGSIKMKHLIERKKGFFESEKCSFDIISMPSKNGEDIHIPVPSHICDHFVDYLSKNKSLLEVGCGGRMRLCEVVSRVIPQMGHAVMAAFGQFRYMRNARITELAWSVAPFLNTLHGNNGGTRKQHYIMMEVHGEKAASIVCKEIIAAKAYDSHARDNVFGLETFQEIISK